jgi:hypothetical protein
MERGVVKRQTVIQAFVFILVVVVGAQLRVSLQSLPNFAPVAALALFAGYFFRSWILALCAPLSVMVISDLQIGGYDWRMMAVVYAMLALPVAMRGVLRRHMDVAPGKLASAAAPLAGLMTCSLSCSILFFVVTNFFCWRWFGMYEPSFAGLTQCYWLALPFFRYTLAGDALFALALFGSYALAANRGLIRSTWTVPATAAAD